MVICNYCGKQIRKKHSLEILKKSQSKWYKKNRELVKLKSKKYYFKNKNKKEFIEKRRKQGRIYREKNRESERKRQKIWFMNNRNKVNKRMRDYRKKSNKMKINARNKAQIYIKIPDGQICQECNINLAIQKHHEDYTKPLKVKFLCLACHAKIHRRLKL